MKYIFCGLIKLLTLPIPLLLVMFDIIATIGGRSHNAFDNNETFVDKYYDFLDKIFKIESEE
jgi:hypothetical protein